MGTGWFVGFFTVAVPEVASRLLFCADVDDGLPSLCACDAVR